MKAIMGQSLRTMGFLAIIAALFVGFHEESSMTKAIILVGIGVALFMIGRVLKEYTDVRS